MSPLMKKLLLGVTLGIVLGMSAYVAVDTFYPAPVVETPADGAAEKPTNAYEVHTSDEIFQMKGDKLKDVQQIILVSGEVFGERQILMRRSSNPLILLYPSLNYDGFNQYEELVLSQFLKDHPEVDYRVTNSLSGVGKMLGVSHDPNALIATQTAKSAGKYAYTLLGTILSVLLFVGAFVWLTGSMTSNKQEMTEPKDIQDDLDDLVGLADIKSEVLQVEQMILDKKLFAEHGIVKPHNMLFTGPPGCGKTVLVRCIAKRLDMPLYYASGASLETSYVGGGPKTLRRLLNSAKKHKNGAIIFLDEAEGLLGARDKGNRHRSENDTSNALLSMTDGVNSKKSGKVIWILASNFDETKTPMDKAMLRRFQHKINFRLPNEEERLELLHRLIGKCESKNISHDVNLNQLAMISGGMSPADLNTLMTRASLIAIQEKVQISQDVLIRAYEREAVGLTDRATTKGMDVARRTIAVHEAGHFIIKMHHALIKSQGNLLTLPDTLDTLKISTEAVSKIGALGFVLNKQKDVPLSSFNDYKEAIIELYGGMANEEIMFGSGNVTSGGRDDISRATDLLDLMYNEIGFQNGAKLSYKKLQQIGVDAGASRLADMNDQSAYLYSHAIQLLESYQDLTWIIADRLINDYVLTHAQLLVIIDEFFQANPAQLAGYGPTVIEGQVVHA
jgi:cell division protease FtsH